MDRTFQDVIGCKLLSRVAHVLGLAFEGEAPILGAGGLGPARKLWKNFSPVLGLAWSPTSDGKTVVRAGAGLFYDFQTSPPPDPERALLGPPGLGRQTFAGTSILNSILNTLPGIPGVPVGRALDFRGSPTLFTGADLMSILPAIRANLIQSLANASSTVQAIQIRKQASARVLPVDVPSPSALHANVGVQREIVRDFVVSADFAYRHFVHVNGAPVDGGATWSAANVGLIGANVTSEVVDPTNSLNVYAATSDSGIFMSSDGGATWSPSSIGISAKRVNVLAVSSSSPPVRAPFVKRETFDAVLPFFRLYGREDNFGWHENTDPADHNYQLDNRLQSYRFFGKHFGLSEAGEEIPVGTEVKSFDELAAGLPQENLTILGLARKIAHNAERPSNPSRELLKETVRYRPVELARAWMTGNTKRRGLETLSYRLEFSNGLSAAGTWLKAIASPQNAPVTIVIADDGRKTSSAEASARVNRGEQVLALDLLFTGEISPGQRPGSVGFVHLLSTLGERALGIQAAQLIAAGRWMQRVSGQGNVRVEASGMRTQVIALAAAALGSGVFSEVQVRNGVTSLRHLLVAPIEQRAAPELFCLDLYRRFDIDALAKLGSGAVAPAAARRPLVQQK